MQENILRKARKEVYERRLKNIYEKKDSRLLTGFRDFDGEAGLQLGHLMVLFSETGMGKTKFVLSMIYNMVQFGNKASYFDMENGEDQLMKIAIKIWGNVTDSEVKEDFGLSAELYNDITHDNCYFYFSSDIDNLIEHHRQIDSSYKPSKFDAILWRISEDIKLGKKLFVIDTLQCLDFDHGSRHAMTNNLAQADIVGQLHLLAQSQNVLIILLHHTNKNSDKDAKIFSDMKDLDKVTYRVPTISSMEGTSRIGNNISYVWSIVRLKNHKDRFVSGITKVLCHKDRVSGFEKSFSVFYDWERERFRDLTTDELVEIMNGGELK